MALSPEAAHQYVQRLDSLDGAPLGIRARALGDAWFVLRAFRPGGDGMDFLRDKSVPVGIRLSSYRENRRRIALLYGVAEGMHVFGGEPSSYISRIERRIPKIFDQDVVAYLDVIRGSKRLTTGAHVLVVGLSDLFRWNLGEEGLALGEEVHRAYFEECPSQELIRTRHVLSGVANWLKARTSVRV